MRYHIFDFVLLSSLPHVAVPRRDVDVTVADLVNAEIDEALAGVHLDERGERRLDSVVVSSASAPAQEDSFQENGVRPYDTQSKDEGMGAESPRTSSKIKQADVVLESIGDHRAHFDYHFQRRTTPESSEDTKKQVSTEKLRRVAFC